ncbi:MAG: hypothetical protein ACI3ZM_07355 [Candidatus Cryptobacteroides sp.]
MKASSRDGTLQQAGKTGPDPLRYVRFLNVETIWAANTCREGFTRKDSAPAERYGSGDSVSEEEKTTTGQLLSRSDDFTARHRPMTPVPGATPQRTRYCPELNR